MFRNPLVAPDTLGVSAGAALGAIGGIFLGAVGGGDPGARVRRRPRRGRARVAHRVADARARSAGHADPDRHRRRGPDRRRASRSSKYLADPYNQLPAITFWLLGSLASFGGRTSRARSRRSSSRSSRCGSCAGASTCSRSTTTRRARSACRSTALRALVICAATLATATAVAISGIIGWIGLVIPHCARLVVGPEFTRLLPVSALFGAAFMLAVDTLGRTIARDRDSAGRADRGRGIAGVRLAARARAPDRLMLAVARPCVRLRRARRGQGVTSRSRAGEVLAVLGGNGSGKTTLFRTLLGLLPPLAGGVTIDGARPSRSSSPAGARAALRLRAAAARDGVRLHRRRSRADGARRAASAGSRSPRARDRALATRRARARRHRAPRASAR